MPERSSRKALAAFFAATTLFTLVPALPAQALGNNREVSRSCGKNYVSSGRNSSTKAWAQTTRISGDCKGRLSATLRSNNGFTYPRVYGNNQTVTASYSDNSGFGTGLHWGCDACNVTYS